MNQDVVILEPLVDRVLELALKPSESKKKEMWADHQALRGGPKIPVCVYYEGIPGSQWKAMFGENLTRSEDGLARHIEFDLRRRIWMAENVPDDHIVWPSINVDVPVIIRSDWGVHVGWKHSESQLGANGYQPAFEDGIDLSKLGRPYWDFDHAAGQERFERAMELTGGKLTVFKHYRTMSYAPFDVATSMRGMENLMLDSIESPEKVKALMAFITSAEAAHEVNRGINGWVNVFADFEGLYQQVGFRVHCAYLPEDFRGRQPRLDDEWTYISQQTAAGLGPAQYADLVQPSNIVLASLFPQKTVYYHGCERLDEKLDVLATTPNLRRFHVSPWSSLHKACEKFRGTVVLEVHDHPGKVFFGATKDEIRRGLRSLIDQANGHPMDLNISDIHSFDGKPELLTLWAQLAQEEAV